jgi:hypothetical protein
MFVLSGTPPERVVFGENGVHRPRNVSLFDTKEKNVERVFADDDEVSIQQLEMLERIRVAAGQTS